VKKINLGLLLLVSLMALPALVYGQGKISFGAGGELALPMGDFKDAYNTGFGGTGSIFYHYMPQMDLLLNAGYITFGSDIDDVSFSVIPIQAGAKYFIVPEGGLYAGALLGVHMAKAKFGDDSESKTKFSFAPMLGYQYPLGPSMKLDISGRYQVVSDANYFGVRLGLNFGK
jgi:opacity protein-like surface antigen